jgi:hypothetical protein
LGEVEEEEEEEEVFSMTLIHVEEVVEEEEEGELEGNSVRDSIFLFIVVIVNMLLGNRSDPIRSDHHIRSHYEID